MARRSDTELFCSSLTDLGGRASNGTLRASLGWSEDKYWRVHTGLFDQGVIEKGRGYGGIVILVSAQPEPELDHSAATQVEAAIQEIVAVREIELYEPAHSQIEASWPRVRQLDNYHVQITAMQGRRDTGGSWSRPDIVVLSYKKFEFLPEKVFDIESFEIKPEDDVSVIGVMEALAHREASTRCYVIYHTNGREFGDFPESTRIVDIAGRHGVGVFAAKDIGDFNQWVELVPAKRSAPDPEALDLFIRRTMPDEAKTKIRKWF